MDERSESAASKWTGLGLATAALALAGAMPAQAQEPIRVGVIDTDASGIANPRKGVTVDTRSFLPDGREQGSHRTASGREHGVDVMSSFVEQSKAIDPDRPIHVLSAVAFYRSGDRRMDEMNNRPMRVDLAQAEKALDWFRENQVKIVITAFVVPEGVDVSSFMAKAKANGITVFAAANNTTIGRDPFPARHPEAISVTGSDRNLDFNTSGTMHRWVNFQASGKISGSNSTMMENGSSFAVGRVAAFGAHALARDPSLDRNGLVSAIRSYSTPFTNDVPYLSGKESVVRIRAALLARPPSDRAAAEVSAGTPVSAARKPAAGPRLASMAALAGSMGR